MRCDCKRKMPEFCGRQTKIWIFLFQDHTFGQLNHKEAASWMGWSRSTKFVWKKKTPENLIYPSAIADCKKKKNQQISLWMLWANFVTFGLWANRQQFQPVTEHKGDAFALPHLRLFIYIPFMKQELFSTSPIPSFSWSRYFPGTCSASLPSLLCLKCLPCGKHTGTCALPLFLCHCRCLHFSTETFLSPSPPSPSVPELLDSNLSHFSGSVSQPSQHRGNRCQKPISFWSDCLFSCLSSLGFLTGSHVKPTAHCLLGSLRQRFSHFARQRTRGDDGKSISSLQ